ncbi:MAG: hypothetical protein DMF68_06575 [Acidobacteria bacterium]|nr:MAG: hypothetical protein DMF68_06575 [Acidobacteriota bacterium]
MAEEGTLGVARASDEDVEPSKEELQRRMEEARQEITQAVTEIKETVTNQYYSMKDTVSDALDWRHHFRKRPIAFSVGALGLGFLAGYGLAGSLKGRGPGRSDYPSHDETNVYARTGATPPRFEEDSPERHSAFHGHSYAAQAIIDAPREDTAERVGSQSSEAEEESESGEGAAPRGGDYTYSSPRQQSEEVKPSENKPSLFDRFKETSAYERLESEVASLGDRFIDELSKTAQNVVLPALFNKIKELFGVDLSNKQGQQAQSSSSRQTGQTPQTASTSAQSQSAQAASASASLATASRGGTQSYATSENRPYNAQSRTSETGRRQDDSVLDLEEQG